MGLETTALIHYPCFSYSDPPKMQVWLPSYLKPINGPHFSPSSKEQFQKRQLCIWQK